MYETFFGLSSRPFLTTPDPDFVFWSDTHSLAFTMLSYGVLTRAPVTVVTGEIGAGKTTLLRKLLSEAPGDLEIGLISNMQKGRGELLDWIMMSLGMPLQEDGYVAKFQRFQDHLIASYAAGRRVTIIIDEAQNLGVDTLEELRMFSNINADKNELLQLILVGQPELRDILRRPELVQFAQRITADYHLEALSAEDVGRYIEHRLEVAGAQWRIFPPQTCALVAHVTRGVPRLVNILCDLCLVYGFSAEKKVIDETLLQEFLTSAKRRGIYGQFSPQPVARTLVKSA